MCFILQGNLKLKKINIFEEKIIFLYAAAAVHVNIPIDIECW